MIDIKIREHLSRDARMKKLIEQTAPSAVQSLGRGTEIRETLMYSIMSQQLSTKVARVIQQRYLDYYKGKFPGNKRIINTPDEDLRAMGLSFQKLNYIKNIALFFEERKLKNEQLAQLSNEELQILLTQIKGVGQWTVEMVLMFCLGREDVFSAGDYGIQIAMQKVYKIQSSGKELKNKMESLSKKWIPYRTYACLYLWAFKDNK